MRNLWILCLFPLACYSSNHLGVTLSVEEAAKKWGEKPFLAQAFRKGNMKERSSMAVDLINRKVYLGKTAKEVRADLGRWQGFFFRDDIPAYVLEDPKKKGSPVWQLVFDLDEKRNIRALYIQQNGSEFKSSTWKKFLKRLNNDD